MPHIKVDHFATALMTYLTERSLIIWRPDVSNLSMLSNEENEHLLSYVATVGSAVEKLSSVAADLNADQFEQMLLQDEPMSCIGDLLDDYLDVYSHLKFIRYMSCLTSFCIVCHSKGHESAPDFAVRSIIGIITKWWSVFRYSRAWDVLESCAQIVNRPEFVASNFITVENLSV